jgi:hypothetical protein
MAPLDSLINSQGKSHSTPWREGSSKRILVAFEDTRFLYRDVLSTEIHNSRPKLTVRSAALGKLEEELKSFVPDVVVCSQPIDVHYRAKGAWVKLATEDGEHNSEVWLGKEHWSTKGPPLRELLEIIDETEERLCEERSSEAS